MAVVTFTQHSLHLEAPTPLIKLYRYLLLLAALLTVSAALVATSPDPCTGGILLPAYSHNDYRNSRPLLDALLLGYRGVEVDLFLQKGDLVVGHDRSELRRERTLEHLYLTPLRDRLNACGYLLPGRAPFLLNIELKERDPEAFRVLVNQLERYDGLFRQSAPVLNAPVRLTLVGWWPRPMTGPDYLSVQLAMDGSVSEPVGEPTSRIGLVSVDYTKALEWNGKGNVPALAAASLKAARDTAEALGIPLRVHQAPPKRSIYQWLLASGVTLIGVKDLKKGRELLASRVGR